MHLRPRTGVEEVDSNQGERTVVGLAIDDIVTLERTDVGSRYMSGHRWRARVPTWNATAVNPLKFVIVDGS